MAVKVTQGKLRLNNIDSARDCHVLFVITSACLVKLVNFEVWAALLVDNIKWLLQGLYGCCLLGSDTETPRFRALKVRLRLAISAAGV
jgi:hypothetical protein